LNEFLLINVFSYILQHNNSYKSFNAKKIMDPKYAIRYEIGHVGYVDPGHERTEPAILLRIDKFVVGDKPNECFIGLSMPIPMWLTKEIANAYGIEWDGTEEGSKEIKKTLEGKTFTLSLDLGLNTNTS
jgi:hypothetical protein